MSRFVLLVLLAAPAWADLYSLTSSASAGAQCTQPDGTFIGQSSSGPYFAYAEAHCGAYSQDWGHAILSQNGYGWGVNYGSLDANTSASSDAFGGQAYANASASFTDTLTIVGGVGGGNIVWNIVAYVAPSSSFMNWGSVNYVLPGSFTYGAPFAISANVAAWAEAPPALGYGGEAQFELTDLEIVDASGSLLPGELESASGHVYQLDAAPVPEPSSVFLFGFCLAACLWRVRRVIAASRR